MGESGQSQTHEMLEIVASEELVAQAQAVSVGLSPRIRFFYHAGWLLLSLIVLALAMTMSVRGTERVCLPGMSEPLPELCGTKLLLKFPCPGCGMTRAFISLGHGRVLEAWSFNPAAFLLFPLLLAQFPYRVGQLWRVQQGAPEQEPPYIVAGLLILLVVMISQWAAGLLIAWWW